MGPGSNDAGSSEMSGATTGFQKQITRLRGGCVDAENGATSTTYVCRVLLYTQCLPLPGSHG
eukprot:1151211-Prymnesium_polylepis.2